MDVGSGDAVAVGAGEEVGTVVADGVTVGAVNVASCASSTARVWVGAILAVGVDASGAAPPQAARKTTRQPSDILHTLPTIRCPSKVASSSCSLSRCIHLGSSGASARAPTATHSTVVGVAPTHSANERAKHHERPISCIIARCETHCKRGTMSRRPPRPRIYECSPHRTVATRRAALRSPFIQMASGAWAGSSPCAAQPVSPAPPR